MLITEFVQVWPESHWEPCNKVGSLSPAERLAGFEPGTFRFWLQCLNSLGHSPQMNPRCIPVLAQLSKAKKDCIKRLSVSLKKIALDCKIKSS